MRVLHAGPSRGSFMRGASHRIASCIVLRIASVSARFPILAIISRSRISYTGWPGLVLTPPFARIHIAIYPPIRPPIHPSTHTLHLNNEMKATSANIHSFLIGASRKRGSKLLEDEDADIDDAGAKGKSCPFHHPSIHPSEPPQPLPHEHIN